MYVVEEETDSIRRKRLCIQLFSVFVNISNGNLKKQRKK